jgi:hypothetical protein
MFSRVDAAHKRNRFRCGAIPGSAAVRRGRHKCSDMGDVAKATNAQLFKHQRSTDFESHVVRRRVFASWLVKKVLNLAVVKLRLNSSTE